MTKGFSIFYNSVKLHCMLANLETYRKKNILQSQEQETVKRVISAEQGFKFQANENVREKMRNFYFVFCNVFCDSKFSERKQKLCKISQTKMLPKTEMRKFRDNLVIFFQRTKSKKCKIFGEFFFCKNIRKLIYQYWLKRFL